MSRLYVRVNVSLVLSLVSAVGTSEARFFAALVPQMSHQSVLPSVRLSAIVTIEFSRRIGRGGRLKTFPLRRTREASHKRRSIKAVRCKQKYNDYL